MIFFPTLWQTQRTVLCLLLLTTDGSCTGTDAASMIKNWNAKLVEDPSLPAGKYKVEFTWEHVHDNTVVVDYQGGSGKVYKPTDDPRCSGSSDVTSSRDGQPFWMPRFNPREVPANVTAATGIYFASIDWQPCGHKDIVICHAESHYDIHFYYVPEEYLEMMPMCTIGSEQNPNLPICQDIATKANHDYFKLIPNNLPKSYQKSTDTPGDLAQHNVDFCVDPSSAILRSGVHYGDKSDTLGEWKTPVTIVGSHECKLLFFEPMVSWKWISNNIWGQSSWPKFEVKDIEYNQKTFKPLPDGWTVEVSPGCKTGGLFDTSTEGECTIKLTLIGDSCATTPDAAECKLARECDDLQTIKDCTTGKVYEAPFDLSLLDEPTKPPVNVPSKVPTEPPTELASQPPTKSATEPTMPPAKTLTQSPTEPPTGPASQVPTEPPTESTEPLVQTPTQSPTEQPTGSAAQPPTEANIAPTEPPTTPTKRNSGAKKRKGKKKRRKSGGKKRKSKNKRKGKVGRLLEGKAIV